MVLETSALTFSGYQWCYRICATRQPFDKQFQARDCGIHSLLDIGRSICWFSPNQYCPPAKRLSACRDSVPPSFPLQLSSVPLPSCLDLLEHLIRDENNIKWWRSPLTATPPPYFILRKTSLAGGSEEFRGQRVAYLTPLSTGMRTGLVNSVMSVEQPAGAL